LVDGSHDSQLATPHRQQMGVLSDTMASGTTAVVFQMHAGDSGPIYHQHQAGTARSNVAACTVLDCAER